MQTFIAVDWGTTNRRVYLVQQDGIVLDIIEDNRGVLSMKQDEYATDVESWQRRWDTEQVIIAGMAGSTRGWIEAPYVSCPANIENLVSNLSRPHGEQIAIVPGVSLAANARFDVMRGEEVQILGAIHTQLAPSSAVFCQPGTHNKWISTTDGFITDFTTVMTGELFALLRNNGILSGMLEGPISNSDAFQSGVLKGFSGPCLGAALFEIRASVLLQGLAAKDAAAYASGLLIGSDIVSAKSALAKTIYLIGSGGLSGLYEAAISFLGGTVKTIDGQQAFIAGAKSIWEHTQ